MQLPSDHTAPRLARQALAGIDAIKPVHDEALLIASELATHAVLGSQTGPDSELELLAEFVRDGLRIAVTGAGAPCAPAEVVARPDPLGIVNALARRWGAERMDRRRVWAVLAM